MSTDRVSIPNVDPSSGVGFGSLHILETFDDAASDEIAADVRSKVSRAVRDFPELAGETVTVARLDPDEFEDGTLGRALSLNRIIKLPAEEKTSFVTVYHELGHLAIHILDEQGEDVATTERCCSIFSMARMPPDLVDDSEVPYLGVPTAPRGDIPVICAVVSSTASNTATPATTSSSPGRNSASRGLANDAPVQLLWARWSLERRLHRERRGYLPSSRRQ